MLTRRDDASYCGEPRMLTRVIKGSYCCMSGEVLLCEGLLTKLGPALHMTQLSVDSPEWQSVPGARLHHTGSLTSCRLCLATEQTTGK